MASPVMGSVDKAASGELKLLVAGDAGEDIVQLVGPSEGR
jgi:3-hydroxyisobutyrate dehydrogenase-like beta-hydroxyacid dehydrogenase